MVVGDETIEMYAARGEGWMGQLCWAGVGVDGRKGASSVAEGDFRASRSKAGTSLTPRMGCRTTVQSGTASAERCGRVKHSRTRAAEVEADEDGAAGRPGRLLMLGGWTGSRTAQTVRRPSATPVRGCVCRASMKGERARVSEKGRWAAELDGGPKVSLD